MKIIFTICFSLALFTSVFSQEYQLSGQLKSASNETVPYATVVLKSVTDTSLIKAELANENGNFTFKKLPSGNYLLNVTSIGYKKIEARAIAITSENIQLGDVVLYEDNALAEVTVTASKPMIEVKPDKTIFNVQALASAAGISAFEVLRKSPGVSIDNNENVILQGKSGVRIFIDGKPSILAGTDLSEYLKTLQASDIDAIELITQPSAKYDAAGNAGIINIKLKKDKRFGTNGSISTGFAYGKNFRNNNGLSFNNRGKVYNLFGTYSNNMGKSWSFMEFYRQQANTVFDQKSTTIRDGQGHNAKIGVDFFLNSKSTLGIVLNGNFNDNTTNGVSRTPISPLSTGIVNQVLVANSESAVNSNNNFLNVNYKYNGKNESVFNIDFDLGNYSNERTSYQPNYYKNASESATLFQNIYRMNTLPNINLFATQTDYEQNLMKGKLSIGVKYAKVGTENIFNFFDVIDTKDVKNLKRSNTFDYTEEIRAAYINYSKQIKKIDLQFGLRAEQTISEGILTSAQINNDSRVPRNYTNLFPSGGITYNPNYTNAWALTYSSRIERPTYQSLNPFEWQIDELSFQRGNAFLQPQYTNSLKLSHTYKYTLNTTLSYSRVNDFFAQITDTLNVNRNFLMERNIADQRVIDLGVSYPFAVNKWWDVYFNMNLYYTDFKSDEVKFQNINATVLSFYGQNTIKLPKKWNFEVSGWFGSPGIWGGTYKTKSLGSLDLALQKKILNDKMSVRIAGGDVLFTSPWKGNTTFGGLKITGTGGWESRQIRMNLSYNFGSNKVKSARQRKTSLEDEKGRID
jgi:iron complex outermembrane recepter protein